MLGEEIAVVFANKHFHVAVVVFKGDELLENRFIHLYSYLGLALRFKHRPKKRQVLQYQNVIRVALSVQLKRNVKQSHGLFMLLHNKSNLSQVLDWQDRRRVVKTTFKEGLTLLEVDHVVRFIVFLHDFGDFSVEKLLEKELKLDVDQRDLCFASSFGLDVREILQLSFEQLKLQNALFEVVDGLFHVKDNRFHYIWTHFSVGWHLRAELDELVEVSDS